MVIFSFREGMYREILNLQEYTPLEAQAIVEYIPLKSAAWAERRSLSGGSVASFFIAPLRMENQGKIDDMSR